MDVITSWTYKFQFTTGFTAFDGVWTVVRIMTFDELIADNISLVTTLYVPVGKTQADYDKDVTTYRTGKVLKLTDPTGTKETLYVPEALIASVPNPNVKRYLKLALTLDVGVFADKVKLDTARRTIQENLSATIGVSKLPDVMSYRAVWLTEEEYTAIEATRDTTSRKTVNYFSENIKLQAEIDRLRTLCAQYEQTLIALAQAPSGTEGD